MSIQEDFLNGLKGKDIIVVNTKTSKQAFGLAHVLRDYARTTFCTDMAYKITESKVGIRSIEEGRVYLMQGNYDDARNRKSLMIKIKQLGGTPKLVFRVEKLR